MRKFSSYGPIDTDLHYYVPRTELIENAFTQLIGETPDKGGHYITIWAPRQTGKTWIMQQVLWRLQGEEYADRFDVLKINLQHLETTDDVLRVANVLVEEIGEKLNTGIIQIDSLDQFSKIFKKGVLTKPVILILDEFDSLPPDAINTLVRAFRNIYISRQDQVGKLIDEKEFLLHGVALIGVRSVLGVENVTGSPFNVQRSLHIPNLTFEEVEGMFRWYESESGQKVEQEVIERLYYETNGQPGLTCWLGELLTETYNEESDKALTTEQLNYALTWATQGLPNNNIVNIISKAKQKHYKDIVLELFNTRGKMEFSYDDALLNFLYMNGVIDIDHTPDQLYAKFPSPFVQKRLFQAFSRELFPYIGNLYEPFEDLSDTIADDRINIPNLLKRYERYLKQNREWLLQDAPKRADLRIYEAVYHFNLYMYLHHFVARKKGQVYPEFPTGNGKIDLIIKYQGKVYGLEVKSFTDDSGYREALTQAAQYGKGLGLSEISLICFVEYIDEENRNKYETTHMDKNTGVAVDPISATGK